MFLPDLTEVALAASTSCSARDLVAQYGRAMLDSSGYGIVSSPITMSWFLETTIVAELV